MALNAPTLAEVEADRRGLSFPKAAVTRLQKATKDDLEEKKADKVFRAAVFKRDESTCRRCLRMVRKTLELSADRAEVHHVHGRIGKLRHLVRAALLLCSGCHERVTGKVGGRRLKVVGTRFFMFEGRKLINAAKPVQFKEAA